MSSKPEIGSITRFDIIVPIVEEIKSFYNKFVGWKSEPVI